MVAGAASRLIIGSWMAILALFLIAAGAAESGPILDDILNAMQIDQRPPGRTGDDYRVISPDTPVGQTFVTGDSVIRICRIAVNIPYWHQDWQPDETLVMTLWNGPERSQKLGRFEIPYIRRQWDQAILMFSVEADVQPNNTYYFELTVEGGDGRIVGPLLAKGDYPAGRAYEGGKPQNYDLWFETHVKKKADREANLAAFFDNFDLNYSGMEKVKAAVQSRDWDRACQEFLTYIEGRRDLFSEEDASPAPDPNFDTREADLVVEQKWLAQDGTIVDLGPNWNYFATWPTLGGVGLTRTGLQKPLAFAYWKTGNLKYARAWNDMLISMFRNVPCPLKSGVITGEGKIGPTIPAGISGTLWDSISIAARLHHETLYNKFRKCPLFEPDVRMAWWANLIDMANTLERMQAGGNWTTQNTSSLFSFARKYPELKKSKIWFAQGFEGLKANLLDNMYADGACKEATTGYHCFSLGMFFDVCKTAREMGLEVPKEHMERLERCFEYTAYSIQPDWRLPIWGDTNRPLDPCPLITLGARYFNRPDLLWIGTMGREGKKPEKTSVAFPVSGYFVMRSGWDPGAKYLATRNGFSQSHYHSDNLGLIVNAYGIDLLPDPGIYTYGTPECNELSKTTSHSTISVDGKNTKPGHGVSKWVTLPGFDWFDGMNVGYQDLQDARHRRAVIFLKPDYWVVADWVTGSGMHTVSQFWRFAPWKVERDTASGAVKTANKSGGNLLVLPVGEYGQEGQLTEGLYAWSGTKVGKAPVAKYSVNDDLPVTFCTVLFPSPAGTDPHVRARRLKPDNATLENQVVGVSVLHERSADYIAFGSVDLGTANLGKLVLIADAAAIRTAVGTGKIMSFACSRAKHLSIGKTMLMESVEPVGGLSVAYSKDAIVVDVQDGSRSLRIATLGASRAILNGREVKLPRGTTYWRPFARGEMAEFSAR